MIKKLTLAFTIAIMMQACSQRIDATSIANTKWTLTEWPGRAIPVDAQATLNFDAERKIGGKSFCNSYGGNSVITGKQIKFEEIFSTKMFCTELSDAENKYQTDLAAVNTWAVSGNRLTLFKDGVVTMVFVKVQ